MNLVETHDLLTLIAQVDNRRFDDATVAAWRELLMDLRYDDCRAAAMDHFGASTAYLMPAHIRQGAIRRRNDRHTARVEAEQAAIEAANPDRSAETMAMLEELRDRLPPVDPYKVRRREVLDWERAAERKARAEPNPHYDPAALTKGTP